ncbi:MAG: UDP-N-acetylmuramoyl-tripeptide-D-alanyl-D-alanine ligase [Candidatus Woesebacteria bacterium GW2011_GWB1_43_14]|uniref:UDP-N-acetylmuramoyl-tripeptide-D-alanyl-D-alanine ligase n=1 Tax=Candidatus Woesebacteria bacterium GW2011_GWB1_43_14 TaxID=1618578 RepID=A0A0G1GE56_9BACT|nr:MAG: UDP-N-acetylmuramoyl-tripeptide-D-alanyl-D-alanine ligase [Candidatus Woesebacteria bacterium GW2011_GWA1_39_11b]KKS78436.1 MAG: UDP-N-acetylmuramoyl-tripeptide-D-alanyl-D-alanine ligase [Candidatus Woesebacteria bacterium GW2011_GWC1_42_9]KKS97148.1 MAG: UDP-N-acetylmuramoyl-tripeptide-D-alanyl-D-alanine ligase [Candidatus Woesebacteria bacterium GW2011_GWB1_43_14]
MSKILSTIYPIADFLYLLQLEEYESKRYFNTIKRFWWRRNIQKRGKLVYTKRINITLALALPFCITMPPFTPLWIWLSNSVLTPYFERIKLNIQKNAAIHFNKYGKNTKVIAIAGSYGKTTVKNYIYEFVRYNYKTQIIPGNINTPTGIANWLLNNFDHSSELLIVEVDTYFVGEIKRSLRITPPDIALLTNVGDQHLERLGSKSNLKKALLEIFDYAKPNAIKICDKKTNLAYALKVAKILNIPNDIIKDTITKLKKPDRRGDVKIINKFKVIDQSYNISGDTAKYGVDNAVKLAKLDKKGLIVITAGIPELGEENKYANKKLGKYLVKKVHKIILLKSILYTEVINNSNKFILANNLNDAWKILEEYDPKKYLILLQPELNDLYYE